MIRPKHPSPLILSECINPETYFNEYMLSSYVKPFFPWGNHLNPHELHSLLYVNKKSAKYVKSLIYNQNYIDHCLQICSDILYDSVIYTVKIDGTLKAYLQRLRSCIHLPMFVSWFPFVFLEKIRNTPPLTTYNESKPIYRPTESDEDGISPPQKWYLDKNFFKG